MQLGRRIINDENDCYQYFLCGALIAAADPGLINLIRNRTQQLVLGERFGQVLFRTDDATPGPVKQAVLAREHDDRCIFKHLVVLDQ